MKPHHTKEYKDSAVQLVLNSDSSAMQIAKELNINSKTLYHWISEYRRVNGNNEYNKKPKKSKESLEIENKRLLKENRILKQERDILKKATAYFAKATL